MSNDTAPVTRTELVVEALPDDFADVLGALALCGWNYTFQQHITREVVHVVSVQGTFAITAHSKARRVEVTWEHVDGEWFCVAANCGYVRAKADPETGEKVDAKSAAQLVNYIGRHIAPTCIRTIVAEKAVAEEIVFEEEEIVDPDAPAKKPAPKPKPAKARKAIAA